MKRSPIRRHARKSPVTSELFALLYQRDGLCAAPKIDAACGPCSWVASVEHVKSDLRTGVRAPSDLAHCLLLCTNHTEPGAKAGVSWNATKEHRALVRAYLEAVNV